MSNNDDINAHEVEKAERKASYEVRPGDRLFLDCTAWGPRCGQFGNHCEYHQGVLAGEPDEQELEDAVVGALVRGLTMDRTVTITRVPSPVSVEAPSWWLVNNSTAPALLEALTKAKEGMAE